MKTLAKNNMRFIRPTDMAFPTVVFFSIAIPLAARIVSMDKTKLLLACREEIIFGDIADRGATLLLCVGLWILLDRRYLEGGVDRKNLPFR